MVAVATTTALQAHNELCALALSRSSLLEKEIDVATAQATWDFERDDQERPVVRLRVTDSFSGEASAFFSNDELRNEPHLSARLHELKGALLTVGEWRNRLTQFYADVRVWLKSFDSAATVIEEAIVLNESSSGPYKVMALCVMVKGQQARLQPVAAWVVGADGRVDLQGPGDTFAFVLLEGNWYWVESRATAFLRPLDETLFCQLLAHAIE